MAGGTAMAVNPRRAMVGALDRAPRIEVAARVGAAMSAFRIQGAVKLSKVRAISGRRLITTLSDQLDQLLISTLSDQLYRPTQLGTTDFVHSRWRLQ